MASFTQTLLKFSFVLYISIPGLHCQQDCTGVDCPLLNNCIEEVLEAGACCASCLRKGCTCEGYQYYDCLNAGFKNGKVPEGDSYFVDYGSTECLCPAGGGRISCHYISCPEMPPNCIDMSEPVDGCMQCERIGCIHNEQKIEAGHSFHIDPCQVCHCPNEGGTPMCYPVPNCSPENVQKAMLNGPPQDESVIQHNTYPYMFNQQDHMGQFPTPHHIPPEGNLPLFKTPDMDNEEMEDYDYGPTDFPDTYRHPLASFTPFNKDRNLMPHNGDQTNKFELKERFGVHNYFSEIAGRPTRIPTSSRETTSQPLDYEDVTTSWKLSKSPTFTDLTDFKYSLKERKHFGSFVLPLEKELGIDELLEDPGLENSVNLHESSEVETKASLRNQINSSSRSQDNGHMDLNVLNLPPYTVENPLQNTDVTPTSGPEEQFADEYYDEGEDVVPLENVTALQDYGVLYNVNPVNQEKGNEKPESRNATPTYRQATPESTTSTTSAATTTITTTPYQATSSAYLTTTAKPLLHFKQEVNSTYQNPRDKAVYVAPKVEEPRKVASEKDISDQFGLHSRSEGGAEDDLVQSCCVAGQTWAKQNEHCVDMPSLHSDKDSICSLAQKQCCLSSVREIQCESGVTAARAGSPCDVDQEAPCPDDSYQVCCGCCALGLQVRRQRLSCDSHHFLGYPCGHVFLTCCEDEPDPSHTVLWSKHSVRATTRPRQVLNSPLPRQALSISATEEATHTPQEEDGLDHCQVYAGQLCQHTCTNTYGSYRCGCHQGYSLQPDGHSCTPESPDEDNRVTEDDGYFETSTTKTSTTTSTSPVYFNPCEDRRCGQKCSVVGGRALCSCLPGFSLMTDGRTCQAVDAGQHCRRDSQGSLVCVTCAPGRQLNNGRCEDIDECKLQTHNCGGSFVCENTPGSFRCRPKLKCITGFTQDPHGNCIDINECSGRTDPCSPGSHCINTVGSYTCQKKRITCSRGYHANAQGDACVDVDECQVGSHHCGAAQICHNVPGSYRCECQTGYQYDALRKICNDVDECWRFPGRLCSQSCENIPGSYRCSCTSGFSLAPDGKNCEDVNECEKNPCSQECANVYGSYQCYCRPGYHLKQDGHTCEDLDECSQSMGNLCAFQCVNVVGSYRCACPPHGYVMAANGHTCKDVDECTTGSHNCSVRQSCFNLQGGFRCLSFDCPPNYNKVTDTRCERLSCPSNSPDCLNSPLRITYYQLSFQTNIIVPAQIFRIGPSPTYAGDHIVIKITRGNDEGYFSTRKLNSHTGAVYIQRAVTEPRDFLIDVEMKLLRQGTFTSFLSRIYVFITSSHM
ncbi:fibulin-2 [Periophthalmus magnuspinnatus]|uniref:fibulin-2 n=1 Tax=Periophthalmus magnuspinnatus TaxID=409849 RepID=UPI00145AA9A4|nr:fibulin-2 [Periophthalmus magnuspinnatus]